MILGFEGEYRFLSNFWPARVILSGAEYPTVEHAYQAAKTVSSKERMAIRACKTPAEAKRMGRKVRIRDDWGLTKEAVMLDLVRQKFRDPLLARMLIDTGNVYIEETNTWGDTYWGVCDGNGLNKLGNILMQVRNEI